MVRCHWRLQSQPLVTIMATTNTFFWIILIFGIGKLSAEVVFRVDPLALLSATLRTYQKAGCDTDQVSLSCPRGTSISIEVAQYGKPNRNDGLTIEDLCPSTENNNINSNTEDRTSPSTTNDSIASNGNSTSSFISLANSTKVTNIETSERKSSSNCLWPNAMQYSLLQTVVEACQKKKHCKFNIYPGMYGTGNSGVGDSSGSSSYDSSSSSSGGGVSSTDLNPCPRIRKFVEIAYKCRPYEFRSKVACKNDVIQLECNPYSRIAIYSASFGRTEYESIQCPQPQGVKEETCLASYATETVMQICHGRRRCNLSADTTTFGSPCSPQSRIYLKVVYTCVPKQVLRDRYESENEPDEVEHFTGDENDIYDEDQFYKESEAIPKLQSNFTRISVVNVTTTLSPSETTLNPILTKSKSDNLEEHQDRLYLYLIITGSAGVLLCLVLVVARLVIQNRRRPKADDSSSSPKGETTISNGFNDSISEIDADIDLATPVPLPSVSKAENYITYGAATNLYGSLGPSNISHTSTTMLLPTGTLMCPRQSPDIIGVANTFTAHQSPLANSSAIGTIVPISSLAQYTSAPTYHPGYIMDSEGVLRRPTSTQPLHSMPPPLTHPHSETFHYDGTAPRTLSSGVAQNAQFYYG